MIDPAKEQLERYNYADWIEERHAAYDEEDFLRRNPKPPVPSKTEIKPCE